MSEPQWYIKALRPDRFSPYRRVYWPPGQWMTVPNRDPLSMCRNGLHICRYQDAPFWAHEELWWTEVHPEADVLSAPGEHKIVVSCARIVEKIPDKRWNRKVRLDILNDLGLVSSYESLRRCSNMSTELNVFSRVLMNQRDRYPRGGRRLMTIADTFWQHVNP